MGGTTSEAALARAIVLRLRERGFSASLVGGCVRDELLGIPPKDYDVATSATPDQVAELFPGSRLVGAHFGVVLVGDSGHEVEVATFRSDFDYQDGRRPQRVAFETDPRQDALRRDFTINALFLDPETREVLDFTGGQADLQAGLIRAIGDPAARFREDYLRLIRAVRLAARFGFVIEPRTWLAMEASAHLIREVSAERIREEFLRILTEGGARRGMELLHTSGLLAHILPEAEALRGVEQPPQFHPEGDVWIHVMMMLEEMGRATPTLALGVLMHDIGKPATFRRTGRIRFDGHVEVGVEMTRNILTRLRCSSDQTDRVCDLVANHMKFMESRRMRMSTLKRFVRQPNFEEHLELHRLDCMSSNRNLENYHFVKSFYESTPPGEVKPERLVTGDDLIRLGMAPGPEFGRILTVVEDAQLEGRIRTHEEALALVDSLSRPDFPVPPHKESAHE